MSDTPLPDISHDQHAVRRNKLAEMRAGGFDPFRANVATSHFSGDAIKLHVDGQDNAVTVTVAGRRFTFAEGERVHTEYSYKYDDTDIAVLARRGGFSIAHTWADPDRLFAVAFLR